MNKSVTKSIRNLTLSGLFLALGLVLPFFTAQIPAIGSRLLPMHIPVLICGFVCPWQYALMVGFILPVLRSIMFGMPPMFPTAIAMAFELAAYGTFAAVFYKLMPKKTIFTYLTLIISMVGGRAVWGIASMMLYSLKGTAFTVKMFMAGAFINAIPGIIIQLIIIPPIVMSLKGRK